MTHTCFLRLVKITWKTLGVKFIWGNIIKTSGTVITEDMIDIHVHPHVFPTIISN